MEIFEVKYEDTLAELSCLNQDGLKRERAVVKGRKAGSKIYLSLFIVASTAILGIVKPEWFNEFEKHARMIIMIEGIIILLGVLYTARKIEKYEQKLDIIKELLKKRDNIGNEHTTYYVYIQRRE